MAISFSFNNVISKLVDNFFLIFVFFLATGICSYYYFMGGFAPTISYFAIILLAMAYSIYLFLFHKILLISFYEKYIQKSIALLLIFFVFGIFSYINSSHSQYAISTFHIIIRSVIMCFAFMILFTNKERLNLVILLFAGVALFDVLSNIVSFFNFEAIPIRKLIVTFTHIHPGRGGGYIINPNNAAYTIILLMIAGTNAVPKQWRLFFWFICGLGVFVSFSRSGWIMWVFAIVYLSFMKDMFSFKRQFLPFMIGLSLWMLYFASISFITTHISHKNTLETIQANTLFSDDFKRRFNFLNTKIIRKNTSVNARYSLIFYSLEQIKRHPLFGNGIGFTREWGTHYGPHNMYLLYAVETGATGLIIYLFFLFSLWSLSSGICRLLIIELGIESLFSHNVLEDPVTWLMIAFAIMYSYYQRKSNFVLSCSTPPRLEHQYAP